MRTPVSWIRESAELPADLSSVELARRLTALGLKLEALERPGADITGPLVVGRVLTMEPEPQKNGKTINWCTVDVGDANGTGEPQGIVCGAHNFEPGDLVVVVLPGGVLPGGFEIAARKTYGHVSAGMICSSAELGLSGDADGIIVLPPDAGEPGGDARDVLGLGEEVIEFEINPDRAYAMSVRGVARESALAYGVAFRDPADRKAPGADGSRLRPRGAHAGLDGAPARPRRAAQHLARGRRHQLRHVRDGPADPRLRRRQGPGDAADPARVGGGATDHARRPRPPPVDRGPRGHRRLRHHRPRRCHGW